MTFTVTRTNDSEASQTIDFATSVESGDSAELGDFTANSGTLTFASGELSKTFTVQTAIDAIYEGGETFTVTLSNNSAGTTIADATGVGTILDDGNGPGPYGPGPDADDDRPTLNLSGPELSVSEGSYAVFKVDLSNPIGFDASVDLALSNLGGTSITDYALEDVYYINGEVETPLAAVSTGYVIPAGFTTFYVRTLTTSDDNLEGLEEFKLTATLEAAVGGASANDDAGIIDDGTGTVYDEYGDPTGGIPDDDTPPPPPVPAPAPAPAEPPAANVPVEVVPEPEATVVDEPIIEPPVVELIVQRDIPTQEFEADGFSSISYTIPADTFGFVGAAEGGEITLSAQMADGQSLPNWLIFDGEKGEFRGVPPEGLDAVLSIRVLARDENGNQVETMINIQVKPGLGDQSSLRGKPGVMDQFKAQSQFAWKAERDLLLERARRLRA